MPKLPPAIAQIASATIPLSAERLAQYFGTVWAIAKSPEVEQYIIGFTARSSFERLKEYKKIEYDYMVIIADKLTRKQAFQVEKYLQIQATTNRREVTFTKYNKRRRGKAHRASYGGVQGRPDDLIHSVYMAWWCP